MTDFGTENRALRTRGRARRGVSAAIATLLLSGLLAAPMAVVTAAPRQSEEERRQSTKNEWRNLALAAGGVAAYGALRKDNTLMFAGLAGALYSLNRYEQDRKSQDRIARARASMFSRDHFYRDGVRYDRRSVNKNGQRYYQFVRADNKKANPGRALGHQKQQTPGRKLGHQKQNKNKPGRGN